MVKHVSSRKRRQTNVYLGKIRALDRNEVVHLCRSDLFLRISGRFLYATASGGPNEGNVCDRLAGKVNGHLLRKSGTIGETQNFLISEHMTKENRYLLRINN